MAVTAWNPLDDRDGGADGGADGGMGAVAGAVAGLGALRERG